MSNKKKGSNKKTWRVDARTDNAFNFAINNVLPNAYNENYPREIRANFVSIALKNILEATMRVQSMPKEFMQCQNALSSLLKESLIKIIDTAMNLCSESSLVEEIARRCGYITDSVNKPQFYWLFEYSHYLNNQPSMGYITNVKNPYDINDINYDFLESHYHDNLSFGIANAVIEYHFPGITFIWDRGDNSYDLDIDIKENGSIVIHGGTLLFYIYRYKMPSEFKFIPTFRLHADDTDIMQEKAFLEALRDDGKFTPYARLYAIPVEESMEDLVDFLERLHNNSNRVNHSVGNYTFASSEDNTPKKAYNYRIVEAGFTGYRLGTKPNPFINLMKDLAWKGCKCRVYIELSARGEAENNLNQISTLLDDESCNQNIDLKIRYNDIKVHAKMMYFTIETYNPVDKKLEYNTIAIFSTGNFNPETAEIYKDYIYLTTQPGAANMVLNNFNTIFNSSQPILSSISSIVTNEICKEIAKGEKGRIWIQTNHLDNMRIVKLLKEAVNRGVDVKLIVRTTKGFHKKDGIIAKTITGPLLEHQRVYIFGYSDDERVYISSSDLMYRNLYNRFESYVKIEDNFANFMIRLQLVNDFEILFEEGQSDMTYSGYIEEMLDDLIRKDNAPTLLNQLSNLQITESGEVDHKDKSTIGATPTEKKATKKKTTKKKPVKKYEVKLPIND